MKCCRCSEEMLIIEYANIELDYCSNCGIWLDSGELELILKEAGGTHSEQADNKDGADPNDDPIGCPVCGTRMDKGQYNEIARSAIDRCPKSHGIWLDKGELAEIVETHTGSGGGDTAVTSFLTRLFRGNEKPVNKGGE